MAASIEVKHTDTDYIPSGLASNPGVFDCVILKVKAVRTAETSVNRSANNTASHLDGSESLAVPL